MIYDAEFVELPRLEKRFLKKLKHA